MSKLLQEAIADAKAMRSVALANAEAALKEAFTPKIQSIVSRKLQAEMEDMEGEDEVDVDVDVDLDGEDFEDDSELDITADELSEEGDEEEELDFEDDGEELDLGGDEDDVDVDVDVDLDGEDDDVSFDDEDLEDDDLDLDELIAELEADLDESDEEEEEFDLDGEDDVDVDVDINAGGEEDEEEFDLDEILRALDEMADEDEGTQDAESELALENEDLKNQVAELEEALSTLRQEINEVTLMNNKLFYVNKLFNNFDMSPTQKKRVVETLDRTNSVREVKLVFTTLAESFKYSKPVDPATRRRTRKSLTESVSKTVGSTKPQGDIINESTSFVERMQQLANIKK